MMIQGHIQAQFDPVQASDEVGRFLRKGSQFRQWITPTGEPGPDGQNAFPAASGRYHLYVAYICPWASRTLMARRLKGLEQVISVSVVEPFVTDYVWRFGDFPGADREPLYGDTYLYQLYARSQPDYTGRVTVPVLWDKETAQIVNNESADILRILNTGFGELAHSDLDLYPEPLRAEIDEINDYLYGHFNNGVYQAGFASSQAAYEEAYDNVFAAVDFLEDRLAGRRYLVGEQLTEADIRAFVTMIRFDVAYYGLFKTNRNLLKDCPAISRYMQQIYALPGIAETVNIEHIKQGYYSIKALNPKGIVPKGPAGLPFALS